ncbi:MAG TPA: hypothetical protein VH229_08015 [Candidatus Udaeobacter sp.]|jgi:hypothetical protein|nr:hypothetical protein [Candidatus Udaeobacter sp.]
MVLPSFSPAELILELRRPEEAKNLAGKRPPPDSDPFSDVEFGKICGFGKTNCLPVNDANRRERIANPTA